MSLLSIVHTKLSYSLNYFAAGNKLTSALEAQAKILHDLSTKTQDNE